jgi:hypothetical protein
VDVGLIGDSQCGGMQGRYGVDRRESGSRTTRTLQRPSSGHLALGPVGCQPAHMARTMLAVHDGYRPLGRVKFPPKFVYTKGP